jgi:hypothetical protein
MKKPAQSPVPAFDIPKRVARASGDLPAARRRCQASGGEHIFTERSTL